MTPWRRVLVVHAGALGDSVLLWPLLRSLARSGSLVTLAARPSHAKLAARWIDSAVITPVDADSRGFTGLWTGAADIDTSSYNAVLTFLADDATSAGRLWLGAAATRWPGAEIVSVGPPSSPSREAAWRKAEVAVHGRAAPRINPGGPILLHVGAGSPTKRWPLDRFITLTDALGEHVDNPIHLIAGEVEAERFTSPERADFARAGGRILPSLDALADELGAGALVVGNDSGPAHLSAQLGVPTLALFGSTDPDVWSPVGPHVRVLAPPAPGPMEAISVEAALEGATDALALTPFHRPTSDRPIITRLP